MKRAFEFGVYDYASFTGYMIYAACTMVIPVYLIGMSRSLDFSLAGGGMIHFCRSMFMLAAMLSCGYAASRFGKARPLGTGLLIVGAGMFAVACAPTYGMLLAAVALAGFGKGFFESLVTPFIQDRHAGNQPGRYINLTHAFWSIGVVLSVTAASAAIHFGVPWRPVMAVCGALTLIPGLLFLCGPKEVRSAAPGTGVFKAAVGLLSEGRFLLFLLMVFLAGGSEHCLLFWTPSFIGRELGGGALMCGAATVCFASGMIAGRLGAGVFVPQNRLFLMLICAALTGVCAGIFPVFIRSAAPMFVMMFILGAATGPLWPSVQSYCADRLKKSDPTLMLILLPCVGIPGCGFFPWIMGIAGKYVGFRASFMMVPLCHLLLLALLLSERFFFGKRIGPRPEQEKTSCDRKVE